MNTGVYRIVAPSGSIYVGMTMGTFSSRWKEHHKKLKQQKHHCAGLQRSFNNYGWESFKLEIVEEIPIVFTKIFILSREQYWWDYHKAYGINIYNGRPTATGSVYHKKETNDRIKNSLSKRPRKEKYFSNVYFLDCSVCKKLITACGLNKKFCDKCRKNQRLSLEKQRFENSKYSQVFFHKCQKCNISFSSKYKKRKVCSLECSRTKNISKALLYRLYINENKSIRTIARDLNLSRQTVSRLLKSHTLK